MLAVVTHNTQRNTTVIGAHTRAHTVLLTQPNRFCTSVGDRGRGNSVSERVVDAISRQSGERLFNVVVVRHDPPQRRRTSRQRITAARRWEAIVAAVATVCRALQNHSDDVDWCQ